MKRITLSLSDHEHAELKVLAQLADKTVNQLLYHLIESNLVHYKDEINQAKEEIEN